MAFFRWDRIAPRRCNPRERKGNRTGCSELCIRRAGLREWDSNGRRKNSERGYCPVFRREQPPLRGLSGLGPRGGGAQKPLEIFWREGVFGGGVWRGCLEGVFG